MPGRICRPVTPNGLQGTPVSEYVETENADSAESPIETLRWAVHGLEVRIRESRTQPQEDPVVAAEQLASMEQTLHNVSRALQELDPQTQRGEQTAAMGEVYDWQQVLRDHHLPEQAQAGGELLREFLEKAHSAWVRSLEEILVGPEPDACFTSLLRTTTRQFEEQNQFPEFNRRAEFGKVRDQLREAMLASLAAHADSVTLTKRQEWVRELVDRGDVALTSIDDLTPQQATRQLLLIEDDICWHLKHVERSRGRPKRQLARKCRRVAAERQERGLQQRLEEFFGPRCVGYFERLVVLLIFLVIGLLTAETFGDFSSQTLFWFQIIDACACSVFLTEFAVKMWFVKDKGRWFYRHFLIDFVPSLPVGVLTMGLESMSAVDNVRFGRLARFLRLPRLVRYIRIFRPLIRLLRGVGLLARGLDRLARRYGRFLNRNVILYPTRSEMAKSTSGLPVIQTRARRLQVEIRELWRQLLQLAPESSRTSVAAARFRVLEFNPPQFEIPAASFSGQSRTAREIPAGILLKHLREITPEDIEIQLREDLINQLSRVVRTFAKPPLCWFPVISSAIPELSPQMTSAEIAAAGSRRLAGVIKFFYDSWFWVADLYGTVTPSKLVDRLGTMLMKSAFRPAYRLAMFGGFLLITELLFQLTAFSMLMPLKKFLDRFVGPTVLVLGLICFFILGFGWWLKRLAQEATEFYERVAEAQFLALTEGIRTRFLQRDTEILYYRALKTEWDLQPHPFPLDEDEQKRHLYEQAKLCLVEVQSNDETLAAFEGLQRTVLLYRDWLDGALFVDSDTRATSQLLGNPALRQFLISSERIKPRDAQKLHSLDLVRQKSLLGGPHLWFNFVTRSIADSVARLLVDYNRRAIPVAEIALLSEKERASYEGWLMLDTANASDLLAPTDDVEQEFVTTSFTALHFLDCDAGRDQEVASRFGFELLRRLQHDRGHMIRRVFGTFPMHKRPKEQRVVNLYALYENWLAHGRALLLPLTLAGLFFRLLWSLIQWAFHAVQEIRKPRLRSANADAADADFEAAIRKINRIRGPVVDASLRLRLILDPEYLGIPLPGDSKSALDGADVESDLRFLQTDPNLREAVEFERKRAEADIFRLTNLLEDGLLKRVTARIGLPEDAFGGREHLRAATLAYVADYRGIRSCLSANDILEEAYHLSPSELLRPKSSWNYRLWGMFKRHWKTLAKEGDTESTLNRKAAWQAVLQNLWGAQDAIRMWNRYGTDATAEGEARLGSILSHPSRITEHLLTLRVVQTLAVLDVLHYRQQVYQLGCYAESGDPTGEILDWKTIPRREPNAPVTVS